MRMPEVRNKVRKNDDRDAIVTERFMPFVPLWTAILDDPSWKILDLPPDLFRFWIFCLLAAQKYDYVDGYIPDVRTLSAWFQMTVTEALHLRDGAVSRHVLDRLDDGRYRVHNWMRWRDVQDHTATQRSRAYRERQKTLKANVKQPSRPSNGRVTGMKRGVTVQHSTDNSQLNVRRAASESVLGGLPPTGLGEEIEELTPPSDPPPPKRMSQDEYLAFVQSAAQRIKESSNGES